MAIDNCLSDGVNWYAEKAYRHYSATYHTPLHEAKALLTPFEAIKISMEDEMAELPVEELQEVKTKLIEASNNRAYLGGTGDVAEPAALSDDEWIAMQTKLVKEQEEKAKAKKAAAKPTEQAGKVEKAAANLKKSAGTLADALNAVQKLGRDLEKETEKPLVFAPEGKK